MKRDEKTGQLLPGSGGRPKGTRNKLTADFLSDAIAAWKMHGPAALDIMAKEEPSRFVQVFAALMPKELKMEHYNVLEDLSDDQLIEAIATVRRIASETKKPGMDDTKPLADLGRKPH